MDYLSKTQNKMVGVDIDVETREREVLNMKITFSGKVLRDEKIISIDNQKKKDVPKIVSKTIPKFIQDHKGIWIKNPEWSDN